LEWTSEPRQDKRPLRRTIIVVRRNVRLCWSDEVFRGRARLRNQKTEVEYGRNNRGVRHQRGGVQVNSDKQRIACRRRADSRSKRTVTLHPRFVVVPWSRSLWGIATAVVMTRMMQQCRRKALRTNLQRKLAIAGGHESDGNERTKR
jgi:hypothetical protein